jgi:hypothetical protein
MTESPRFIQHGTAGANSTPIHVDVIRIESAAAVSVKLTASYTLGTAPGLPQRPGLTGASQSQIAKTTLPAGTIISLLAGEAAALIAAGAAVAVDASSLADTSALQGDIAIVDGDL